MRAARSTDWLTGGRPDAFGGSSQPAQRARAAPRRACRLLVLDHERRRHHDLLAGRADDHAAFERARMRDGARVAVRRRARRRASGRRRAPRDAVGSSSSRLQPVEQPLAELAARSSRPSRSMIARFSSATAQPTGWPLYVNPCRNAVPSSMLDDAVVRSARRRAGRSRSSAPFAVTITSGSRPPQCSARTSGRCGRSRSRPRRASAGSRARAAPPARAASSRRAAGSSRRRR
jgi:hypothetical protein